MPTRAGNGLRRQEFVPLGGGSALRFPEVAMRAPYATTRGAVLQKTPSARQQAGRRWMTLACAALGLALASGLLGSMIHDNQAVSGRPVTGPFSYFPSE